MILFLFIRTKVTWKILFELKMNINIQFFLLFHYFYKILLIIK